MQHLAFIFALIVFSQVGNIARFAESAPLAVCFWRLTFSILLISPFLLHQNRWRELLRLNAKEIGLCVLSGVSLFLVFTLFVLGIQSTTVANTTVLFSLHPLFTAVGAALFCREAFNRRLAIALALGFTGVVVLFSENLVMSQGGSGGYAAALASAFFFSVYLLSGKLAREKLSNANFALVVYAQAALCSGVAMFFMEVPFTSHSSQSWLTFLALAIGPTILGHALFTWCLKHLNINMMSCATLLHPALAAVGAYLAFHESLSTYTMFSLALSGMAVAVIFLPVPKLGTREFPAVLAEPEYDDGAEAQRAA